MQVFTRFKLMGTCTLMIFVLMLASVCAFAQYKTTTFEAIAYGQGRQAAQSYGVKIVITGYSTFDDRDALMKVFLEKGSQGLADALKKMPSLGKLSFTGEADYDIRYVKVIPTDTGRTIRVVTDRFMTGAEARGRTNLSYADYNLSVVELNISNDKKKSTGTFLPACELLINKDKGIEVQAYRNPWRLEYITEKTSD